jgi:hypothetical protein
VEQEREQERVAEQERGLSKREGAEQERGLSKREG